MNTIIEGLYVSESKIIEDSRGALFQLGQGQFKNLIAVTIKDNKPRGGHYHKKAIDEVWTVSGCALWFFIDMRDESTSKGKVFSCRAEINADSGTLTRIQIPAGVYHIIWKLSNEPMMFIETKTMTYDERDYIRIPDDSISDLFKFKKENNLL